MTELTTEEKLKIAVDALLFYADLLSWECDNHHTHIDGDDLEWFEKFVEGYDCSDYYGGKKAREALCKIGK